ncbi:hypothetical protein Tco_0957852, partial [Tanacetum coccineum]
VCIWSVSAPFLNAGSASLWLGDGDLLLATLDSQLKIFDSLLNNHASGEHSQCYSKVRNIIAREIGEPILNNKDQHVLDVIDTKSWEVIFLECVKFVIGSSTPYVWNHVFNAWKIILSGLCLCCGSRIGHARNSSLQILEIVVKEVVNQYYLTIPIHD